MKPPVMSADKFVSAVLDGALLTLQLLPVTAGLKLDLSKISSENEVSSVSFLLLFVSNPPSRVAAFDVELLDLHHLFSFFC